MSKKSITEVKRLKEQLRIGIVSGRFNSDNNEENEKVPKRTKKRDTKPYTLGF